MLALTPMVAATESTSAGPWPYIIGGGILLLLLLLMVVLLSFGAGREHS